MRTVLCAKHGKELPALPSSPFPGPEGDKILESISEQAW